MNPKVSVSLITYNHARFIGQAIEGVLMQRTSFPFELVIGEDVSTDETRKIVQHYAAAHPDLIRARLPEKNLGMNPNFAGTIESCRGEYIALLDGDDYWTDPEKLQRQADFLDAHPQYSTCFHRVKFLDEDGREEDDAPLPQATFTLAELLSRKFFAYTASVMFRAGLFGKFPAWFYECPVGDFPTHAMNGLKGDFGYLDRQMAVYRFHSGGVWTAGSRAATEANSPAALRGRLRQVNGTARLYEILLANLGTTHVRELQNSLAQYRLQGAHLLRKLEDWPELRRVVNRMMAAGHLPPHASLASVCALVVQAYLPITAKITDRIRRAFAPA